MGPASLGRTVLLLAFSGFVAGVDLRLMDSLLPTLSTDFGVTVGQASWAISANAIGYGLFQFVIGLVGDRLGKYRVIIACCFASSVATLLCSFAPSIEQLVVARALSGAAASGIVSLALAWIGDNVAMESRQSVMAKYLSGTITGGLFGPAIGGVLADHFGWRSAFLVLSAGFLTAAVALALGGRDRAALAESGGGTSVFAHLRTIVGSKYATTILAAVVIEAAGAYSVLSFAGASLHERFGIDLGIVGAILASFALGGLIYTFSAPRLLRRFTQARMVMTGGLAGALGVGLFGVTPWLWLAPLAVLIFGLGFYLIHSALQVHATQILPRARAAGLSVFSSCFFIAQSVGVLLAAAVVDRVGTLPVFIASSALLIFLGLWLPSRLGGAAGRGAPAQ